MLSVINAALSCDRQRRSLWAPLTAVDVAPRRDGAVRSRQHRRQWLRAVDCFLWVHEAVRWQAREQCNAVSGARTSDHRAAPGAVADATATRARLRQPCSKAVAVCAGAPPAAAGGTCALSHMPSCRQGGWLAGASVR